MVIPNTLHEKYSHEREMLYNLLEKLDEGILSLASGSVSSYSLGNRSCSYQDIDKLKNLRSEIENRVDEIEAALRGASVRNVQVSTFLDPSLIFPRRLW